MSWAASFCEELAALKRAGFPFEIAWDLVVDHQPPRLRELGARDHTVDLFEIAESDRALDWYKARCRDAWDDAPSPSGERSRLGLLPGLLGALDRDWTATPRKKHLAVTP